MPITYRRTKVIDAHQLADLFLAVNWDSGKVPEKLARAVRNSHRVITAWDGARLVGLINALSDGVLTVYFHYLLVRPEYQRRGIGKTLVKMMLHHYSDFARKVLIAYDVAISFYKKCGFEPGQGKLPMFITQDMPGQILS